MPNRPHPFAQRSPLLQIYLPKDKSGRLRHANSAPTDSTRSTRAYSARASVCFPATDRLPARNARAWAFTGSNATARRKRSRPCRVFAASLRKISRLHQQRRILWGQSKSLAQCLGRTFPIIIEICFDHRPGNKALPASLVRGRALVPPPRAQRPGEH